MNSQQLVEQGYLQFSEDEEENHQHQEPQNNEVQQPVIQNSNSMNKEQDHLLEDEEANVINENQNKENQEAIIKAMRYRSLTKSCVFIGFFSILVGGLAFIYQYYAFLKGSISITQYENLNIEIKNCNFYIFDYSNPIDSYLIGKVVDDLSLTYHIPGSFNFDVSEPLSYIKINENQIKFHNVLSSDNCFISLIATKKAILQNFNIHCTQCTIVSNSKDITYYNFSIEGKQIDANLVRTESKQFFFKALNGRLEMGYAKIEKFSDIHLEKGDIIFQTDQEMMVNWTHANPYYALASPFMGNPTVIGCEEVSEEEKQEYLTGVVQLQNNSKKSQNAENFFEEEERLVLIPDTDSFAGSQYQKIESLGTFMSKSVDKSQQEEEVLFQPSCYGMILMCQDKDCRFAPRQKKKHSPQIHYEPNPQGDNTRQKKLKDWRKKVEQLLPHTIPDHSFLNVSNRFGNIYVNLLKNENAELDNQDLIVHGISYNQGELNFGLPSQKLLLDALKKTSMNTNFDPIFKININSKASMTQDYQQYVLTYNPAYSYLRPWFLGAMTFGVMNSESQYLELNLSPGYLPYRRGITQEQIQKMYNLLNQYFNNSHIMTTFSWPNSIELPKQRNETQSQNIPHLRIIPKDDEGRWILFSKKNESSFSLEEIKFSSNTILQLAYLISMILSYGIAISAVLLGVTYMAVQFRNLKDEFDSIKQYEQLEHQVSNVREIQNKQTYQSQLTQFISQLPPCQSFLDYLMIQYLNSKMNSANEFCYLLFEPEDSEHQDIHDTSTESLNGMEMKLLYEKYCYLNGYIEKKLNDEEEIFKKMGFKFSQKQDAYTQAYCNVLIVQHFVQLETIPESSNSLTLFIENCCKLTNFEEDNVPIEIFNAEYQQFCLVNQLPHESITNESLTRFNIKIQDVPQVWLVRIEENINEKLKIKKICSINVTHQLKLLQDRPELIKKELNKAREKLILPHQWYLMDILISLGHVILTILIAIPFVQFTLLQEIFYQPYSLVQDYKIISLEDIINIFPLIEKLPSYILIWMAVYLILAIIDVLIYYQNAQYPQKKIFKLNWQNSRIQMLIRVVFWTLLACSLLQLLLAVFMAVMWLMLGAIVNPNAFLPYATASIAFFSIIMAKAQEFNRTLNEGFDSIIAYIKEATLSEWGDLVNKMNLKGELHTLLQGDTMKYMFKQAADLGLTSPEFQEQLEKNADDILTNPEKFASQAIDLAKNPQKIQEELLKSIEERAVEMMKVQFTKYLNQVGDPVTYLVVSLFKNDFSKVKVHIQEIMHLQLAEEQQILSFSDSTFDLIWEFGFGKHIDMNELESKSLSILSDMIIDNIQLQMKPKHLKKVLNECLNIVSMVCKQQNQEVMRPFERIIHTIKKELQHNNNNNNQQFAQVLDAINLSKLIYGIFKGEDSIHELFALVKDYLGQNKILNVVEFLLYCNHNCCSLEIESLDLQLTNKDDSNLYIKKILCYSKKHITQQNLGNVKQLWSPDHIKFYGEDYDENKLQPLIQGLFNLSQFALDGNQKRLLKVHTDVVHFSINKHFCYLVNKTLIIKYGKDLQEPIFQDNPIIGMLGRYLNIQIQQMLNILMEIFYEPQEWSILYLSQIYRIPKESVRICFYILNIFRSKDEVVLYNSLQGLQLTNYFNLIKAFKGILNFNLLQQRPKTFKLEDSIQTSWEANGNVDMKNLEHVLLRAACDETVFISYSNIQDIVNALANKKNGLKDFSLKEIEFLNTIFKIRTFKYNKISDIESATAKELIKNFTTVYSLEYGRFMDVMNFLILNNPKKRFNLFVKFQKTTNIFLIPNKEYNDFQVYLKYLSQNYQVLENNQTFVDQTLNKIVCMDEQMPQLKLLVPHILTIKQGPLDPQFYNILTFENKDVQRIISQKILSPQEIENSFKFKGSPGQQLIFKMINDPIQHYMDYISEMLEVDEFNYVTLMLFLKGKSKNIKVKKQPILEYISNSLNINTEYLESLHIFYQKSVSKCSSKILRLVKRHAQQKQVNIPIKLLITINENQVKQILQLANGEELAIQKLLPQIDVQFLQLLTLLQQLKNKTVQYLTPQFRSLNQLFQTLDVKTEEFITILQLLYCPSAKQIKEVLKLENVQLLQLQENFTIDSVIDYNSPEEYSELYKSFKESSTLKLQFNQYDYNYVNKFFTLVKGISQAHVGCLTQYFESIKFLECGPNFLPILKGLIGCIAGDLHKDFNLDIFLRKGKGESQVEKALMNMRKIEVNPLLMLLTCGIKRGWVSLSNSDVGLISYALFKFNSYKKQEQHFISTLSWQRTLKTQIFNQIIQQFNPQRHDDIRVILKNYQDLQTIINLLKPNEQQHNQIKQLVELYLLINDQALYETYKVLEPERIIDWKYQAKLLGFRKDLIQFLEQFYQNKNYELQLLEIGMEGQEKNQKIQELITNKQEIPYDSEDYEQIQPIINLSINLGIERVIQRILGKNDNPIYNLQITQSIATLRTILTYNNEDQNKYRQLPKEETVYDKINDLLECIKQQLLFTPTVYEFSQFRIASLLGFSAGYVMTDATLRDTQYGQRFCDYQSKINKNAHIKAYLEYFNQQYDEGKQDMVVEAMYRSMLREEIETDYIYDTLQDEQPQVMQSIQYDYQSLTQYYNIINSHTAQITYWLNLFKGNYQQKDIYVALLGLSRAGIKSVSYENILHQLVNIGLEQTQSNKKILYELLSILLNCFTSSQSIQLSLLIEEENLLDPLINCVFRLETSPKGIIKNFESVLKHMDLNNHDKSAISSCVRTYFGETDVFEFAAKEEWRNEAIKQFVQGIKYSEMHQYEIEEFQDFSIVQENIEGVWNIISREQKDLSLLKQSLDLLNVAEVFEKFEEYQELFRKLNIGTDQQFVNIVKFLTNSPNIHLSQIIQIDQNYGQMLTQYRQGNLFESLICMMEIDELRESALLCLSLYFWVNLNKVQQFIESKVGRSESIVHFSKDITLMYIILYLPICINIQVGEVIEAFSAQMEMKTHYRTQLLKQSNQLLFYHQQIGQFQYKHQKWGDRKLIKLFKDLQIVSLKEFDKLGLDQPSKEQHSQMIGMCVHIIRMGLGIDVFDSNSQFSVQQQDQQICNHILNYYETGSIHNILNMIQLPIPEPFINIIGHLVLSFTDKSKQLIDIVDLFKSVKDRDTQEYLFLFHDLIIKEDRIQTFGKLFKKLEKNAGNLLTFGNVNIPQIVNGCSQVYTTLMIVVNQPNKSISDKQFQGSILQLLQDLNILNLNLPIDEVNHIMRLLSGEVRAVVDLIRDLRLFDQNILLEIEHMFDKVESLGIFNAQIKIVQPEQSKMLQDMMEKIKNGNASAADIFKIIDEDQSNSINQKEFGMLSRRLGMELSSHRIMEIFAEIKKNQSDQLELDLEEFEQSLQYLNEKNSDMALEFLGISKQQLLSILITIGFILLFIFLFIFLGIQAFALGGTFGAVVNSILPMIFATSTAQSFKQENKTEKEKIVRNVKKSKKLIQSNKI